MKAGTEKFNTRKMKEIAEILNDAGFININNI